MSSTLSALCLFAQNANIPVEQVPMWYQTWWGILAILLGIVGAGLLMQLEEFTFWVVLLVCVIAIVG